MATRDWATLPDTALVSILEALPAAERLACAALVNASWAAAAVVATEEVCLRGCSPKQVATTLAGCYSNIYSLEIHGPKQLLPQLPPLRNLEALRLLQTCVQLGPPCNMLAAVSPGSITQLVLHDVEVEGGLDAASVLTSLKHLSVTDCVQPAARALRQGLLQEAAAAGPHASAMPTEPVAVPSSLLPQLQELKMLELKGGLSDSTLEHISLLTRLDSLALDFEGSTASPAALAGLDRLQGLSVLALTDATDTALSAETVGGLSRLTQLEVLFAYNCRSIDPLLLAPLTALQHLDLENTPPAGGTKSAELLLGVLAKLQHLTFLDLSHCLLDTAPAPAAAYSALTASSNLAFLDIQGAQLPAAAWSQLFPVSTGGGLPRSQHIQHLQRLHLTCGPHEFFMSPQRRSRHQQHHEALMPHGLSDEHLSHLVRVCPGLRRLQTSLQPDTAATALVQLTALTALALQGVTESIVDDVLPQLAGLRMLHILPESSIGDTEMLQLCALTGLVQLGVHHVGCSDEFLDSYIELATRHGQDLVLASTRFNWEECECEDWGESQPCFSCARCLTDVPHNVWLQLLRCCVKCDECWPLLLPLAIIYGNQLSALKQQRQDVQRKVQSLCAGASSGSSGNNCMVETQLRVAELLQEARRLVLVVEDLKTALKMVLNAYEGTTDSSSECEV